MSESLNGMIAPASQEKGFLMQHIDKLSDVLATYRRWTLAAIVVLCVVIIYLYFFRSCSCAAEAFMPTAISRYQDSELFGKEKLEGSKATSLFAQNEDTADSQEMLDYLSGKTALQCTSNELKSTDAYAWVPEKSGSAGIIESLTPSKFKNTDSELTAAMNGY